MITCNTNPERCRPGAHTCLLVNSTGIKVAGHGEWNTRQHGAPGRRTWIKVHLLTDASTGEIVDLVVTAPTEGGSLVLMLPRRWRPPRGGAMRWDGRVPAYRQRNRHIDNIRLVGRTAWKRWAGYPRRSAVESTMHRLKWVTGERALPRTLTSLKVEVTLRAMFLNSIIASAIC